MKVTLVTGASSGIGAAIAIEFADAGWSVMAAGRDEERLAEVADASENIVTWEGDLETSDDCDDLIADTDDGIYMQTNRSWSIDQYRYNFQFGTEIGWEIFT